MAAPRKQKSKKSKRPVPKKKPARKPAPKQSPKKPAKKPPATQATKPPKQAPKPPKKPGGQRVSAPAGGAAELLGEITVPSGKLCVFDVGLVGYLPRPALEPAIVTADVPADRPLAVLGRRIAKGRFADCWDHVSVRLAAGEIATSKKLGEAGVDFARLVFMDHGALDHWQHEDSLDGLADFVFWGRDAASLARVMGAPAIKEGYGWTNLPVEKADARALEAARIKSENHWLLATDFRPHSHHFHALAAARKSSQGAGTIEVGGATICLFFTSWGDGVFPVYLDLDAHNEPVAVRVQLNLQESVQS